VLGNPIEQEFGQQAVRTEHFMVLLPRDHPAAARRSVTLGRLAGMPAIFPDEDSVLHRNLISAYHQARVAPKIASRCHDADLMFELVASGIGIAFLPRVLAQQQRHRGVRCVMLGEPNCAWTIAYCWRSGAHLSAAGQAWLAHAREQPRAG